MRHNSDAVREEAIRLASLPSSLWTLRSGSTVGGRILLLNIPGQKPSTSSGAVKAQPSALSTDGTSFSVKWVSSGP